ncbi:MAG TPA: T9SS type A sorting domain-containing protein [Candidatus Kapabacteria bacterium]|nr:T9SS type A sorting domain-containing protein [Candidatus Kapabacteria bacterium]
MVRRFRYQLLLLLLFVATDSNATWQKINDEVTAFDMQSNGTGLIAISRSAPYLAKKTPTSLEGVIAMTSPIIEVSVVDQDVAFMVVRDSGLYMSSNGWRAWKKIDTMQSIKFLLTTPWAIIGQTSRGTQFWYQDRFYIASGLDEKLLAIDYFNDSTLIGISEFKVYRSTNYGRDWSEVYQFPEKINGTLYIDRWKKIIHVGGKVLRYSTDRGMTWKSIVKTSSGDSTKGAVYGTPDCTGAFYIISQNESRPTLIISRTQSQFIQILGASPGGLTKQPVKVQVFSRGNTLWWLDTVGGQFWASTDGADGSAVDSIKFFMTSQIERDNLLRICRETFTTVDLQLANVDCVPIVVDSIRQLNGKGQVYYDNKPFLVTDVADVTKTLSYYNSQNFIGRDTIRMRAYIHSSEDVRGEFIDFTMIVRTLSDPAEMTLNKSDIDFGEVKLAKFKEITFSITNSGCDPLRVDSVTSTYPEIFSIKAPKAYPFNLAKGARADFVVKFTPLEEGPYLEALEIGTNGGHEFMSLYGVGAKEPQLEVDMDAYANVRTYPNPFISSIVIEEAAMGSLITLHDIHGREYLRSAIAEARHTIDAHHLPAGTYVLNVGMRRFKLIKE